jgi:SAM-dependent methyltransferase
MQHEFPASIPCSWADGVLTKSLEFPKIWTQEVSRPFAIYWSKALGFGALYPSPTEQELSNFYNIPSYDKYLAGTETKTETTSFAGRAVVKLAYLFDRGANDPIPTLLDLCKSKAPAVCDIGCGSGEFLSQLKNIGCEVTGIDPSPVSKKAVSERGIEFFSGTAEDIPKSIAKRRFDAVTMFQSLEHCRNPARAVANAKGLLKPGGLLVIDVPNNSCLGFQAYRQVWFHTDAGRHLQFFTPSSLRALCERAGLIVEKIEYCGFTGQFTAGWIAAMRRAWDITCQHGGPDIPPHPSLIRSLCYLLRAIVSPREKKYDVVRVYATAPL